MICMKCGKVLNFEKIITPEGKAYHVKCFDKFEQTLAKMQSGQWDKFEVEEK